jgi:hypothetical protein
MKKLIISGCSITHGAETVNGFMHLDNITNSYSYHLAKWMNLDLVNVALSGGSNDDIFHSLMQEIDNTPSEQIHSVVAAWTGVNRLHWVNKGRHWFFIPGWASSMENVYDWQFHQHSTDKAFITGDSDSILETLYDQHRFLIDNYLDDSKYLGKKLLHYKKALGSYCEQRSIKLIDINIMDEWKEPRHPTADEHSKLAMKFYQKFYVID